MAGQMNEPVDPLVEYPRWADWNDAVFSRATIDSSTW
jgi:hypothetical protein